MIYTVTLNPALDYTVYLSHFALGKTNRSCREELFFGGKGINVSAVLTALGEPTVALGFVAGFTGQALLQALAAANIGQEMIHLPEGQTRINVKIKGEQESEINATGPDVPPAALAALMKQLDGLRATDTLVLAGSVPPSLPDGVYEEMLHRVAPLGVRVAVDAERALLLRTLPYHPFLIKPNLQELSDMVGRPLSNDDEIAAAAAELQQAGAKNVLVSLGGEGALLLDEHGRFHRERAVGGAPVNTVGAGDSMVAGFLCGVPKGYAHALRLAIAAGSATATGSGLATGEEIGRLMREFS
ncbi:MAG: 1-phosphofructokinase [Ruminococcaceae bacterium]|nr:1-phosphofructokinase [Oscillospiraceae bacterium]